MTYRLIRFLASLLAIAYMATAVQAGERMKMAVTTSFHNSGLAEKLLPEIKTDLGLIVDLLVVGTGQALRLGRAGDVDAVLVHSRNAEDAFIAEGSAPYRREIMYNDFVIIGPESDPAKVRDAENASKALSRIADAKALFASRGDDSGTHKKELALWEEAGIDEERMSADWYRATGSGMGATLNTAAGLNAYVLADRASWLNFANKADLQMLFSGDPVLFNQYAYMPVSQKKHPHVRYDLARKLEDWLVSEKAQSIIANYMINGETLFVPNAK